MIKHGYWQVELDEKCQLLMTFLTEWGIFWYQRLLMGLFCYGDIFCERTDHTLTGLEVMLKLINDILIYADNVEKLVL